MFDLMTVQPHAYQVIAWLSDTINLLTLYMYIVGDHADITSWFS